LSKVCERNTAKIANPGIVRMLPFGDCECSESIRILSVLQGCKAALKCVVLQSESSCMLSMGKSADRIRLDGKHERKKK
jgi:hypothetical protein